MPHSDRAGSLLEAGQETCHSTRLTAHLDKGPHCVKSFVEPALWGMGKVKHMLRGTTTLPGGG